MNPPTLPDLICACANARRASRLVTRLYAHELGSAIEPSQFSLLTALKRKPRRSQTALGAILGLDKTSLSRNLRLMQKNGWIEPAESEDPRERAFRLTPTGLKMFEDTQPRWQRAQNTLRKTMGTEDWDAMQHAFQLVARAAAKPESRKQTGR